MTNADIQAIADVVSRLIENAYDERDAARKELEAIKRTNLGCDYYEAFLKQQSLIAALKEELRLVRERNFDASER